MFSGSNSVEIGTIIRLYGIDGAFLVKLNIPEAGDKLYKMESVFIKKDGILIPFFVEMANLNNRNLILKLKLIDHTKYAERFLSCTVLTTIDITSEHDGRISTRLLNGFQVIDVNFGVIGVVQNINEIPGNHVLEVDYKGKTVLIPIADNIIKDINHKKRVITAETPKGLIELYL